MFETGAMKLQLWIKLHNLWTHAVSRIFYYDSDTSYLGFDFYAVLSQIIVDKCMSITARLNNFKNANEFLAEWCHNSHS